MAKVRDTARPPPSPWASLGMAQPSTQEMLDAAAMATMMVPVAGDVAGLASDAYRFATDPESRTLGNAAWASLGMLPFVPAMGAVTRGVARMGDIPTRWYHGGSGLFDEFDPKAPHIFESVKNADGEDVPVFWAAAEPDTAYDYAAMAGARGANAKISEFDIVPSNPKIVDVQAEIERLADELGVDVPSQGTDEASALLGGNYKYDVIQQALSDGHDAVVFNNFADTPNYFGQTLPNVIAFVNPSLAKAAKPK